MIYIHSPFFSKENIQLTQSSKTRTHARTETEQKDSERLQRVKTRTQVQALHVNET